MFPICGVGRTFPTGGMMLGGYLVGRGRGRLIVEPGEGQTERYEATVAKEQKTTEELNALLRKEFERYQLGSEPNIQSWCEIIPVDVDDEGANWTVSHGPKENPPGDIWKAVERAKSTLQKIYDLQ